MNEKSQANSENRKALPKFALTMAGALLIGGALGFVIALSHVFGLNTASLSQALSELIRAATPWGIPVTSVLTLGGSFLLYRSAAGKFAAWEGGDEDELSESADLCLSWVLLLSAVQLLINLFFMTAIGLYYYEEKPLLIVGVFLLSCGLVIFAQQKTVDLEKRMNPEKRGSVYDTKFHKKWLDSCDESERRQIGEASYRAYTVTSRLCLGLWLALTVLSMVFEMSLLPVFILLLVWGTMQVTYALESIRLSRNH